MSSELGSFILGGDLPGRGISPYIPSIARPGARGFRPGVGRLGARSRGISILESQEGLYGVFNFIIMVGQAGSYRVQNNIKGYIAWVGVNALPDLTQPPYAFSFTLPMQFTYPAPGSGLETLYVIVRTQDHYGLQSQNQYPTLLVIDSSGNIFHPPVSSPQDLRLIVLAGNNIRVLASYPGVNTDIFPATHWQIYINTHIPNPSTEFPNLVIPVNGLVLSTQLGPEVPNTYYVMVRLIRDSDGNTSPTVYSSVVINNPPGEVVPVPGGLQGI